jgi:NAD(P)-dependent dehydrogenase (short-subunit alcohol dehydrogenase family)
VGKLLEGQHALVTGGNSGVGKGIALELAAAGSNVIVNFLEDSTEAEQTVGGIAMLGVRSWAIRGDVGLSQDVERIFGELRERVPRLNLLVNNVGVQTFAPLLELSEADWDQRYSYQSQGLLSLHTGSGSNDEVAEKWLHHQHRLWLHKHPFPRLVSYTASKGGIEQFTKAAAVELAEFGIRVNCVAPGAILTERTSREASDYEVTWSKATPLGRVGTPRDVGKAVVFLASDDASYISGQTLWADGAAFTLPNWPYPLST